MANYRKIVKVINKMGNDHDTNENLILREGIHGYRFRMDELLSKCDDIKKLLEFLDIISTYEGAHVLDNFFCYLIGVDEYFEKFLKNAKFDKDLIQRIYSLAGYAYLSSEILSSFSKINALIEDEEVKKYSLKCFKELKKIKYLSYSNSFINELENKNDTEIKEWLIDIFGDMNYCDEKGSLLHLCISFGNKENLERICFNLLELGVDPNLVNQKGYNFLEKYVNDPSHNSDILYNLLEKSIQSGLIVGRTKMLKIFFDNTRNYKLYKLLVDNGVEITNEFDFSLLCSCEECEKINISAHFRLIIYNIKLKLESYSYLLEENFNKELFYVEEDLFEIFEGILGMDDDWYNLESLILDNILKNKESEIGLNKMISANEVVEAIIDVYKNNLDKKKLKYQTKILEYRDNQVGGYNGKL